MPYLSVSTSNWQARRLGFWKPFQSISYRPPWDGGTLKLKLLGVKFDDQLLRNRHRNIVLARQRGNLALQRRRVHFEPLGSGTMPSFLQRILNSLVTLAAFANFHHVARLHQERRHIDFSSIHGHVAMQHHLSRLRARTAQTHAVKYVVQAALEQLQQVLSRDALHLGGLLEVIAADLLLLA